MKIVINSCFGGFGISHKAVMRYAELSNIKLYPYLDDITVNIYKDKAVIGNPELMHHYSTIPIEGLEKNRFGYTHPNDTYWTDRDIKRDDKILIQVITELGKEANGNHAELTIVDIPDDVDWTIEEYDGAEHIAEKHRTWS